MSKEICEYSDYIVIGLENSNKTLYLYKSSCGHKISTMIGDYCCFCGKKKKYVDNISRKLEKTRQGKFQRKTIKHNGKIDYVVSRVRKFGKRICPDCDGYMSYSFYDAIRDCNVYKCDECGEEWF